MGPKLLAIHHFLVPNDPRLPCSPPSLLSLKIGNQVRMSRDGFSLPERRVIFG